jgi:putative nucleotidyltransferase with HDIG domain
MWPHRPSFEPQVIVFLAASAYIMCPSIHPDEAIDGCAMVAAGVRQYLAGNELVVPMLPDVAVRVVRSGRQASNAHSLAAIISADATLTMHVLRIAVSAAKRPAQRIVSLQHALAWLGIDEVANIAFTLALQGKMLDVKGQQRKARRLWRHSLASALWARQLAHMLDADSGVCYLCGLLHNIGKAVTLGAVHEVALRLNVRLSGDEYDRLVELFHHDVGVQVVDSWALPEPVPNVIAGWQDYAIAGPVQREGNIVNLAHLLADFTLHQTNMLKRDELVDTQAYHDLGLKRADADPLFESAAPIDAELDRYLSP